MTPYKNLPATQLITLVHHFFHSLQDFVTLTRESQHFVVSAELTQYSTKVNEVAEKLQKDSRFIPNLHYPRVLMLQKARHH